MTPNRVGEMAATDRSMSDEMRLAVDYATSGANPTPHGTGRLAQSLSLTILACLVVASSAVAQDRVVIQQPGGSRFPMSGVIDDYNGRDLVLIVRPGEPHRRYPRKDVVEVQTAYTARHERGRQLLLDGKPTEAKVELAQAMKDEDRTWVRREILALLVKCALWDGNYRAATPSFLSIVESDPETMHYGLAPLAWTDTTSASDVRLEARGWLADRSLVSQLIGASHLLFDPEWKDQAETALRRLARESNIKLQRLAQMQLWRVRSLAGNSTQNELLRWEAAIEDLPEELRAGGYFVLGQTLARQQEPERAAAALLWLPLVYDADRYLAARACLDASEMLESFGDESQAATVLTEVVFRFGDTPSGRKAEAKWKQLRKESGKEEPAR